MLVYDIECVRPPVAKVKKPKYEYASGWEDYKGMGIAVLAIYDYMSDKKNKVLMFTELDFQSSIHMEYLITLFTTADLIAGFNIKKYDNNMLRAHGIPIGDESSYDILEQLWFASGLTKNFDKTTHSGFSLSKVLSVNFPDEGKSMEGKDAPFMWQDGKHKEVIDYCIHDVKLETMLLDKIFAEGGLISPKTKKFVKMPIPRSK
jgi:hypothetical protein